MDKKKRNHNKAVKAQMVAFYGVQEMRRIAKGCCHVRTKREQRDMDRKSALSWKSTRSFE